jgi:hypothetical protein
MKKLLLIILATLFLSGCGNTESTTGVKSLNSLNSVETVEYPEYGYVCFVSDGYNSGGIDCEPITNN